MFSESSFLASTLNYLYDPQGLVPCNYTNKVLDLLVAMCCNLCSVQLLMPINNVLLLNSGHQQILRPITPLTPPWTHFGRGWRSFIVHRAQLIFKTMVAPCCWCNPAFFWCWCLQFALVMGLVVYCTGWKKLCQAKIPQKVHSPQPLQLDGVGGVQQGVVAGNSHSRKY